MNQVSDSCDPEPMKGNDRLFVMFTSGSTGGPKGLAHTQAGYLLYVTVTYQVEKTETSMVAKPVGDDTVCVCVCVCDSFATH